MADRLLVKVTCGTDDPERSNQAFTVASAAVAAGAGVSLWLTGEAAWFASAEAARTSACRTPRRWRTCWPSSSRQGR